MLASLLVAALTAGTLPAPADHLDQPPLLWSAPIEANGWVAFRFRVASTSDLMLRNGISETNGEMYGAGLWYGTEDNLGAIAGVAWTNRRRAYVATTPTGALVDEGRPSFSDDWPFAPTLGYYGISPGEYIAVLMATVDGELEGTYEFRGTAGVSLLGVTSGRASLIHDEQFGGAAHARASEEIARLPFVGCVVCPRAQATALAHVDVEISDRLFGWYRLGMGHAGYTGPGRTGGSSGFLKAEPPGSHRFWMNASVDDGATWLMAGDVRLPPPAGT